MLRSFGNIRICTGKATVFINLRIGKKNHFFSEVCRFFYLNSFTIVGQQNNHFFPIRLRIWKVREIYRRILWMWKRQEYSLVEYHLSRRLVGIQKRYLCRCNVHFGAKSIAQLLQRLQKRDNKIRFQVVVNVFKFDKFKSTLRPSSRKFS